jgi:hypothetical protein
MTITTSIDGSGTADVAMEHPPVNALPVAGWFELADVLAALGRDTADERRAEFLEHGTAGGAGQGADR